MVTLSNITLTIIILRMRILRIATFGKTTLSIMTLGRTIRKMVF
jgi:hypothetical protein